jgi:hypothetical protein
VFYPERGGSAAYGMARSLCACCRVRRQCLADALAFEVDESYGFCGGLTAKQRRVLLRRRRLAVGGGLRTSPVGNEFCVVRLKKTLTS